ncbi:MAG: DUF362 domain-containing protein [Thermodesulfobacteriota bacterium]
MQDHNTVFFTPWGQGENMMAKAQTLYEQSGLFDVVQPGDKVAVKLHVGELGNPNYVRPFFLKQIVDEVKARGGKPFLTDTCTYYPLKRNNAVDHMETALANGFGFAPFIVADGLMSENGVRVDSPDPMLSEVDVAGAIHQADAMIVVSHLKGHPLGGFGGAIKNLGMGGVTKKSKLEQHRLLDLVIDEQACQGCGTCVDACWFNLPRIENECVVIDSPYCMRCPLCSTACPEGAIRLQNRERLPQGLAVAAKAVLDTFEQGKVSCVNFATDVSTVCDCAPIPGEIMGQDVGIFASASALSIDAAGLASIDYQKLDTIHSQDCHQQVRKLVELGTPGALKPQVTSV